MKIFIKKSPINTDFRELCISQQNTKTLIFGNTQNNSKKLKSTKVAIYRPLLDLSFFVYL